MLCCSQVKLENGTYVPILEKWTFTRAGALQPLGEVATVCRPTGGIASLQVP